MSPPDPHSAAHSVPGRHRLYPRISAAEIPTPSAQRGKNRDVRPRHYLGENGGT